MALIPKLETDRSETWDNDRKGLRDDERDERGKNVPSRIRGSDEPINKESPSSSRAFVSSGCGSGRNIFCVQFLLNRALTYMDEESTSALKNRHIG
jgi:hypothetical protein